MRKLMYFALALAVLGFVAGPIMVAAQGKTPGTVILKGAPMGGVKFDHAAHEKLAGGSAKCGTCHHASKPEKAYAKPNQRCQDCHTKVPTPPVKTKAQAAFHDAMGKKGVCIDCHVTQKKGPLKCAECHKKENT